MHVIGIDVGGTFTDLVTYDSTTGRLTALKVPSTPRDPSHGVLNALADAKLRPFAVQRVVHGSTVATNTILEESGARVLLITTAGFRDVLEIGRTQRMVPGSMFDPTFIRPRPLVPRRLRVEALERVGPDGAVLQPLDEGALREQLRRLVGTGDEPEAVAVCFLHAYANQANEQAAAAVAAEVFGDIPVSTSGDVVGEYREFERFSTTVLNAYVSPRVSRYIRRLGQEMTGLGYPEGALYTMASGGGFLTTEAAARYGVKMVLSGPVGGVAATIHVARVAGVRDVITCDMGGTSTDVALIRDLHPQMRTQSVIGAYPIKLPQVAINTVGAGGGSIAWVDADSVLHLGPQSAGADPGPACYGHGGQQATVTDANVALGRIGSRHPLGGSVQVQADAARAVVGRIADRLGISPERAADGILRIAVTRMVAMVKEVSIRQGHDPRDFTLVPFGGAGPLHATQVAEELGIRHILVPVQAGNFSALGMLVSDLRYDYVRPWLGDLARVSPDALRTAAAELRARAAADLEAGGFAPERQEYRFALDLRYSGQAFELAVPFDPEADGLQSVRVAFHALHEATFGHSDPDGAVELVSMRLAAHGLVDRPEAARWAVSGGQREVAAARVEERPVYFDGATVSCPVYQRELLPAGARLEGPAVIEESGATTVLTPGWDVAVDLYGNLLLTQRGERP